jgi:hypothetical protein
MPDVPYRYSTSRKRLVMLVLVELVRALPRGYFVKRGAIQWSAHDFDSAPLACAVHCDSATFLRDEGMNSGTVTLEMLSRIPTGIGHESGIDDDTIDDMTEDASRALGLLEIAVDPEDGAYPIITRLDRQADEVTEVADVLRGLQGVIATARVEF